MYLVPGGCLVWGVSGPGGGMSGPGGLVVGGGGVTPQNYFLIVFVF